MEEMIEHCAQFVGAVNEGLEKLYNQHILNTCGSIQG